MPGPIPVSTDLATLVAFDPALLKHRVRVKNDWWRVEKITALPEIAQGKIAVLPIGDEGSFRVSLRVGALEESERPRARGKIEGLGLEVASGQVFVGAAERLPGDGQDEPGEIPGTGALWSLEPGRYALTVWALDWRDEASFFDEDNEPLGNAPSDFVLVVAPAQEPPDVPFELPALLDLLPKREAKGGTHVPKHVIKRRSEPEPTPRRRSSSSERTTRDGPRPRPLSATAPVPEEKAPLTFERVAATFREVLAEHWLHPPQHLDVDAIIMRPKDRTLLTHEVKTDLLLEKITRVREHMRVFEQRVNGDEKLPIEDIVDLETRISNVYAAVEDVIALLARRRP